MRQLCNRLTTTLFPSVDLQQLCDAYRGEGEIDLPRELIDNIMRYNDLQTLKACSLTSRTFYSAARPLIHRRMVLRMSSAACTLPPFSTGTYARQADMLHAQYLSAAESRGLLRYGYVREVSLEFAKVVHPERVLQLRQLRALETVHTLTIKSLDLHQILPIFDDCFSQFVPTLRSLYLQDTSCESVHQLMGFICRFPHLEDLELIDLSGPENLWSTSGPPRSEEPRPQQPLPLGGHLVLKGTPHLVQSLLDLQDDICFHSIEVSGSEKGLAKLLVASSSTLEVLKIRYCESCKSCIRPRFWRAINCHRFSHFAHPSPSFGR